MKFHIRDILWLTVLAAVAVAWWLDHRTSARRLEELHMQVQVERVERELERARAAAAEAMAQAQQLQASEVLARAQQLEAAKGEFERRGTQSP